MSVMRQKSIVHPDQLPLRFDSRADLDRLVEQRAAERLEADAFLWRLRIISIESLLLAGLVAGLALAARQPSETIVRAATLAGAACFAAGMLALGLTAGIARLVDRIRQWRSK
ncbi:MULTISPECIES: hypothetical protein [Sphingomonas]|nr:hypothetical protein [Sphingomonas turrisvirgatae]